MLTANDVKSQFAKYLEVSGRPESTLANRWATDVVTTPEKRQMTRLHKIGQPTEQDFQDSADILSQH